MINRSRILIAEDHTFVAELSKRLLEREFDVIGIVSERSRPSAWRWRTEAERNRSRYCYARPEWIGRGTAGEENAARRQAGLPHHEFRP